jgi:hypothetical protein
MTPVAEHDSKQKGESDNGEYTRICFLILGHPAPDVTQQLALIQYKISELEHKLH